MYTTLQERIKGVLNNPNADEDDKINMIIHHIIKPIAKEAFEAGTENGAMHGPAFVDLRAEKWANEKLVTSNKQ